MSVAIASAVVALLLGAPAIQELVVRGIRGGETQPAVIGVVGAIASLLILVAGVAHWRRWPTARSLLLGAGALSIGFHAYAALPPHVNVGRAAMLIGVGYGLVLIALAFGRPERFRATA
jgi:hypothetical protein